MTTSTNHRQRNSFGAASWSSSMCRDQSRNGSVAPRLTSGVIRMFGIAVITSVATATPSPSNRGNLKARGTISSRDSSDSGSSLSGGAIAGIVIGVIVFFAILEFLWERERIMTWIRQRKSPQGSRGNLDPESNSSSFEQESKTHSTATSERSVSN